MYNELRQIPLSTLFPILGYTAFRKRKSKDEWCGVCPVHEKDSNTSCFSFSDSTFHCFKCGVHGGGAIDAVMRVKKVNFTNAIEILRDIHKDIGTTENPVFDGKYEKYFEPLIGYREDILKRYGVGVYNNSARKSLYSNHVMFPIRRFSDGNKVGYLAAESENGEILWPKIAKHLEVYGSYELKQLLEASGQARFPWGYVVDSPFQVLRLAEAGAYGVFRASSLSEEQAQILSSLFLAVEVPTRKDAEVLCPHCYVKVR